MTEENSSAEAPDRPPDPDQSGQGLIPGPATFREALSSLREVIPSRSVSNAALGREMARRWEKNARDEPIEFIGARIYDWLNLGGPRNRSVASVIVDVFVETASAQFQKNGRSMTEAVHIKDETAAEFEQRDAKRQRLLTIGYNLLDGPDAVAAALDLWKQEHPRDHAESTHVEPGTLNTDIDTTDDEDTDDKADGELVQLIRRHTRLIAAVGGALVAFLFCLGLTLIPPAVEPAKQLNDPPVMAPAASAVKMTVATDNAKFTNLGKPKLIPFDVYGLPPLGQVYVQFGPGEFDPVKVADGHVVSDDGRFKANQEFTVNTGEDGHLGQDVIWRPYLAQQKTTDWRLLITDLQTGKSIAQTITVDVTTGVSPDVNQWKPDDLDGLIPDADNPRVDVWALKAGSNGATYIGCGPGKYTVWVAWAHGWAPYGDQYVSLTTPTGETHYLNIPVGGAGFGFAYVVAERPCGTPAPDLMVSRYDPRVAASTTSTYKFPTEFDVTTASSLAAPAATSASVANGLVQSYSRPATTASTSKLPPATTGHSSPASTPTTSSRATG